MKQTIYVQGQGKVTLTDREYLASGGQASVYVKDKLAYKIYTDITKTIPLAKINELKGLTPKNVLRPKEIINNTNNVPIGYVMDFKAKTHPMCKLFTKSFKKNNRISPDMVIEMIKRIQETVMQIHRDGFLVVDMNELNLLASSRFKIPYFIDVDSYSTPSFKATAIMESIRDPQVKSNNFTELSDWFSFGIIAFNLYTNIHPFKGKHPSYAPKEWLQRMKDGISVFDPDVSIPSVCNDFSTIPPAHLDWFKSMFVDNNRSVPPLVDGTVVVVPVTFNLSKSNADFEVTEAASFGEDVLVVRNIMGVYYAVGFNDVFKGTAKLPHDISGQAKVNICEANDMSPVICKLDNHHNLVFEDYCANKVGEMKAIDMMYRNGAIYSVSDGRLFENTFVKFGNKIVHTSRVACNVHENATHVFDGVLFQDLLGKCFMTLPFEKGKCAMLPVKELDAYRILEARSEGNVVAVLAEQNGKYDRFVFSFDDKFQKYILRKDEDVNYSAMNLTVLPNGICALASDANVELFKGSKVKIVADPPFNSQTYLFSYSGGVHYIDGNKVMSVSMRK